MTPVAAPEDQREEVAALFRQLRQLPRLLQGEGYTLVSPSGEAIELPESGTSQSASD